MFQIDWLKIMDRPLIPTIMSLLIGFGIAALFRPLCKGPECLILKGPPVSDIKGYAYQMGNKCVEFIPKMMKCPTDEKEKKEIVETLTFADFN
jgi:hypothetical protein